MLKARLSAMEDVAAKNSARSTTEEFAALRARLATVQQDGLSGIFAEFGLEQLATDRGG
jgi:cell fate (sporulation/competence/biofilm development) regulator YlbF (YheA/YmcA/DUF963 family)